ncbi:DUF6292 family protein [Amycolatopsis anabasis]|uniref:DUF6292 family protein n=1 Tax=Amycolatopsis anabasis TaxID=1840409 RepID=UPI00131B9DA1|nr:DUF6292 family protein [Amycolatopsis anabasis]
MTSTTDPSADAEFRFDRGFRAYLGHVAAALGIGLESCTIDLDIPVSAYLALDWRVDRFPERDLALLWDEQHGWSAAIETHSGEDLIVLAYLGGPDVLPDPGRVVRFLTALRTGDHSFGQPDPPNLRRSGNHGELARYLA